MTREGDRVRVGILVVLDVDPALLGAAVIGAAQGAESDIDHDLSIESPGDVAFIGGAVAREVFGLLEALGAQGGLLGRARVVASDSCVISSRGRAGLAVSG